MKFFERHTRNPILKPQDWPYPIQTVFNPGATKLADGRTLLLCRCEDFRGMSHLCVATSENGVDNWQIDERPTFESDIKRFPEELWGVEDPRITYIEEFGQYAISYTAFGEGGPGVALAFTKDFKTFRRKGLIMQPEDKDAALFPRRFKDGFALIHRPITGDRADMWVSFSPDLKNWGRPKLVLKARRGAWWDANKIGLSPPPIETPEGWILLYHGVRKHASGSLYRLGAVLVDLHDPTKVIRRGQEWIFGPDADYERIGDVPNVVFPTGWVIDDDNDTLRMYYGAADTSIGLATGSIKALTQWLMDHGRLDSYIEEESLLMTDLPGHRHSANEPPTSENLKEVEV